MLHTLRSHEMLRNVRIRSDECAILHLLQRLIILLPPFLQLLQPTTSSTSVAVTVDGVDKADVRRRHQETLMLGQKGIVVDNLLCLDIVL